MLMLKLDWTAIPAYNLATKIVARASNRVIVGTPYCRNAEYLERCIMYTQDLNDCSQAINKYPWYLKPYVALLIRIIIDY
jgi:hypothetical protein